MLENPTEASSIANTTTVKRYTPPNQRNRSLGRKKSGVERSNSFHGNEGGEKNQSVARNVPIMNNGDASNHHHHQSVARNVPIMNNGDASNHHHHHQLISLSGRGSNSEAYHLLNDRWNKAINSYNDTSIDLADRPVMYYSSVGPALPQFRLPHQVTTPRTATASSSQRDFLTELRQAMNQFHFRNLVLK